MKALALFILTFIPGIALFAQPQLEKIYDHSATIGLGEAFPNPAGDQVTIPVQLPSALPGGTLEIVDMHGIRVMRRAFFSSSRQVVLPASLFAPGTYLYYVKSGQVKSASKKLVIP